MARCGRTHEIQDKGKSGTNLTTNFFFWILGPNTSAPHPFSPRSLGEIGALIVAGGDMTQNPSCQRSAAEAWSLANWVLSLPQSPVSSFLRVRNNDNRDGSKWVRLHLNFVALSNCSYRQLEFESWDPTLFSIVHVIMAPSHLWSLLIELKGPIILFTFELSF